MEIKLSEHLNVLARVRCAVEKRDGKLMRLTSGSVIGFLLFLQVSHGQSGHRDQLIKVEVAATREVLQFVKTPDLFAECWDTLPQPNFWRLIMRLPPDSAVLNVRDTRQVLEILPLDRWDEQTDEEKEAYRDTLRLQHGLDTACRIFMTTGKRDFYQFEAVLPSISKGIEVFVENGVDPWYAQAILMIESPAKLAYSKAGALGPFQLMRTVARKYGLTVNKTVDERKDFDKSARASAQLIRTSCIPEAQRILRRFGIEVGKGEQTALWFKLVVLHIYHAGAQNVEQVLVHVVQPEEGGMHFINSIWHAEFGRFGNASQNYSQLALASLLVLDDLIGKKYCAVGTHSEEKVR